GRGPSVRVEWRESVGPNIGGTGVRPVGFMAFPGRQKMKKRTTSNSTTPAAPARPQRATSAAGASSTGSANGNGVTPSRKALEVRTDGKGQIFSHIRHKWLVETPEERVRQ